MVEEPDDEGTEMSLSMSFHENGLLGDDALYMHKISKKMLQDFYDKASARLDKELARKMAKSEDMQCMSALPIGPAR